SGLNIDMKLNKPSGLTLEQFKKVLKDNKDTNKIFENNAEYFYYIEKQYNINGIFVAAIGIQTAPKMEHHTAASGHSPHLTVFLKVIQRLS
ncbi:MAG: hypothetical protein II227_00540, partial [Clostridia bacterium]|nr:hypothetical protein [Clostridia bacterium]